MNNNNKSKKECREQIQEDITTYMNPLLDNDYEFTNLNVDDLCQIVVDNFKKLEENVPLVHPKQNTLSNMVGAACFVTLFIVFIALVLITLYNKLS